MVCKLNLNKTVNFFQKVLEESNGLQSLSLMIGAHHLTASLGLNFFLRLSHYIHNFCILHHLSSSGAIRRRFCRRLESRREKPACYLSIPSLYHNHGSSHAASFHNYSSIWALVTGVPSQAQKWLHTAVTHSVSQYPFLVPLILLLTILLSPSPSKWSQMNHLREMMFHAGLRRITGIKEVQLVLCTSYC